MSFFCLCFLDTVNCIGGIVTQRGLSVLKKKGLFFFQCYFDEGVGLVTSLNTC